MAKLGDTPRFQGLLPFVRPVYGRSSCYKWRDSTRRFHDIHQHEGGEPGDPLMLLLFSLAIHDALLRVKESLLPGELLFAFLNDVHAVTHPSQTRAVYNLLAEALRVRASNSFVERMSTHETNESTGTVRFRALEASETRRRRRTD